jgi:hypothetical protein
MEKLGKKQDGRIEEVCPTCGVARREWPGEGVTVNGTLHCCHGCADGTGCTCRNSPRSSG